MAPPSFTDVVLLTPELWLPTTATPDVLERPRALPEDGGKRSNHRTDAYGGSFANRPARTA